MENYHGIDLVGNATDLIEVALALEVLAYHNKNLLTNKLCDNKNFSEYMQYLLKTALQQMETKINLKG